MPALQGEATQAVVGENNHLLSANTGILDRKPTNENTVRAKHAHTTEGTARPCLLPVERATRPAVQGEAQHTVVGENKHLLSANTGILERKPTNENTVRAKHAHTTEGTARPSLLSRRAGMHARSTGRAWDG